MAEIITLTLQHLTAHEKRVAEVAAGLALCRKAERTCQCIIHVCISVALEVASGVVGSFWAPDIFIVFVFDCFRFFIFAQCPFSLQFHAQTAGGYLPSPVMFDWRIFCQQHRSCMHLDSDLSQRVDFLTLVFIFLISAKHLQYFFMLSWRHIVLR